MPEESASLRAAVRSPASGDARDHFPRHPPRRPPPHSDVCPPSERRSEPGRALDGLLLEDRTVPTATVAVEALTNADESGSAGTFRFTRSGDLSAALTVALDFAGTATWGIDYTSPVSITFGANADVGEIAITPNADNWVEADDETVTLTLGEGSSAYVGIGDSATLALIDDAPFISINSLGDVVAGGAPSAFRFTRSGGDLTQALPVTYSVGGTAAPDVEYVALSGAATFAAGSPTADAVVAPKPFTPGQVDTTVAVELTGDAATYLSIEGWSDFALERAELTIFAVAPAVPEDIRIVAAADAYAVVHDRVLDVTVSGPSVLANDVDYDELALAALLDTPPSHGTVALEANGTFVYTPAPGFVGEDTFWYVADDGENLSDPIPVAVSVINHRPVPFSAAAPFSCTAGSSASVLAVDGDGDPLTYSLLTEPDPGTVVLAPNGAFVYSPYDPTPRFDRFAFEATDEVSVSDEGTQHLWEAIPIPEPGYNWGGAFTGVHDRVLPLGEMVAVSQVYDPNNPPPPWYPVVVTPPEHGTLDADLADFTPDAGYIGTDTFTFYLTNNIVSTNVARVYLTITNVAPVTRADAYATPENVSLSGDVTENDDDLDYDPVTAQLLSGPSASAGALTLHPDGTFDFVPTEHYHGITSFTYWLTDGVEESLTSTAYITVQADPMPDIVITDGNGVPIGVGGLKVAKWSNAFEASADGNSVQVRGPDGDNHDFIDNDPDRFNVWVYDPGRWNRNVNGTPTIPHIQAKVSTTNVAGYKGYNDTATPVDLVRFTGGDKAGWYWSDSQILVSVPKDDEHTHSDYLGADESEPGNDGLPKNNTKWKISDRTHRVALNGTVKAEYVVNGERYKVTAGVPAVKETNLHINILRNKAQNQQGTPVITDAEVLKDVTAMREIYAQVQIRVNIVGNRFDTVDPPVGKTASSTVDLTNGLEEYTDADVNGNISVTTEEKALLGEAKLRTPPQNGKDDIEAYYVNFFANSGVESGTGGEAFPSACLAGANSMFADSIIISKAYRDYGDLAHEAGHILEDRPANTDPHYPYTGLLPTKQETVNLMVRGGASYSIRVGNVTDSRRLTQAQQDRMTSTMAPRLISDA